MFKIFEIENYENFDKKHADYFILILEQNPEVKVKNKQPQLGQNYLWYYFPHFNHPVTWKEAINERLNPDPYELEYIIEDLKGGPSIEKVEFSRMFSVRGKRFGYIEDEDIIMKRGPALPKKCEHISGRGNAWHYYNGGQNIQQKFQLTDAETRQVKDKMKK